MTTCSRWIATVAILPAILVFTGCDKTIDSGDLESEIAKNIEQQAGETVTVKCPSDVTAEKGRKLTCTVTRKTGAPITATVTLLDGEGKFTYALTEGAPAGTATTPPAATTPPPATTTPPATTAP